MHAEKVIWVLEDDPGSQFVYEEILGIRYQVRIFTTLNEFRQAIGDDNGRMPDLLIADIRLPDESFLSFLSGDELKPRMTFPFVVVSSVDDLDALRLSFDEGAVDYLTKPFGKGELVVKVERIFTGKKKMTDITEKISIDRISLRVCCGERSSDPLTTKELQILTLLKLSKNQTATREEILSTVWNEIRVGVKTLDVHIFNLRRKLAPLGISIQYQAPNFYALRIPDRSGE